MKQASPELSSAESKSSQQSVLFRSLQNAQSKFSMPYKGFDYEDAEFKPHQDCLLGAISNHLVARVHRGVVREADAETQNGASPVQNPHRLQSSLNACHQFLNILS